MSNYFDGKQLFNEPSVEQIGGSHMVMSNVVRPLKKKYVNIDSRFRQDYNAVLPGEANFLVNLPEPITKIRSMKVTNIEIPFTFYNVSQALNNCSIVFTDNTGNRTVYTILDGFYSANNVNPIATYFSNNTINSYIKYNQYNTFFSQFIFTPSGNVTSMTITFSVDYLGNFDKLELKRKIGWLLGFRTATYTLTSTNTTITSEAMMDFNGFRYLYLAIDEFTQNTNDNTFISPLYRSIINKNIIARINLCLTSLSTYPFGDTVLTPNEKDGALISDKRLYNLADFKKLNIQLVDAYGKPLFLNGLDFSFCMEIEQE